MSMTAISDDQMRKFMIRLNTLTPEKVWMLGIFIGSNTRISTCSKVSSVYHYVSDEQALKYPSQRGFS